MDTMDNMALENLYAHFPFCETKCHYCDFFSLPEAKIAVEERGRVYRALEKELDSFSRHLAPSLRTVFLGGGTPSLIPTDTLESFLRRLPVSASTEITMEANPSSITLEKARIWRALGVNRISMGVQALDDARLAWLGRAHNKAGAFAALEALFLAGFENVSIDLITGVPGQTSASIRAEIAEVLPRFDINHVSAYLLTLKPSNPLASQLPNDDVQLEHLRTVRDTLGDYGFEQYEISNFARNGARALHNENYWLGGGYLGIGPSAHSYFPGVVERRKNWASLGKYCELVESNSSATEWTETLDEEQLRLEFLMLRLRRSEGLELKEYTARFNRDLLGEKRSLVERWTRMGHCLSTDRLQLRGDGFFLSDKIISDLV